MLVDEISSGYAYTEDNMIWGSVYNPLFSIKVVYKEVESYPWFSLTGSSGIDVYEGEKEIRWLSTVYPKSGGDGQKCEKMISLSGKEPSHITMYLPTYASIAELYVGFPDGTMISSIENSDTEKLVCPI